MSNQEVIQLISENFVPVALNLYTIRKEKSPAGDLFRSVYKQKPQYQGLWLVTPDGKALASHQAFKSHKTWTQEVLADLKPGLQAFGPIKPRQIKPINPLPFRGLGVRSDGRVTLAVQERFVLVKNLAKEPAPDALGATVLDSITLTAKEWSNLIPPKAETGSKWTVPPTTARQFFPILSVSDIVFRDPQEVTAVEITGQVQKVEKGIAHLTFAGHIAGTHHGTKNEGKEGNQCSAEAKLLGGVGTFDLKDRTMRSLTLVFDGLWRNWAPFDKTQSRFGVVVEWSQAK